MVVRGDERGQSIQIGAIFLFGVLVISFATYQAVLVPQQNAAVEAEHAEVVDRQTQELRNAIVSVPGSASDRAVTLSLGTTYPSRVIAVNPPPPSGAVRTVGTGDGSINLTLANAVATDGETRDFWDGTDRARNTGAVVYAPNYNEFRNPGTTVYENTLLYAEFRDGEVSRTGQRLVDGDRLTLVALNGSLDRGGSDSVSLDVQAVSASDRSVTVRNETGANVTVRVASRRSADVWRDLLEDDDQFVDQGGHVVSVTERPLPDPDFDLVAIELEQGVTYTVRMAKVGLGTRITGEPEVYLTDVRGEGASVQEGATTPLVVEVRDAYNNPVTGVTVEAGVGSGSVSPQSVTSDGDGQAVFEYEADDIDGVTSRTVPVNASIAVDPGSSFDPSTPENVTVNVTVQNTDGSGVGGTGGDTTGPEVTTIDTNATTDASRVVTRGTVLNLTALASDVGRGGTDIVDAEWWSNRTSPGGSAGSGFALRPLDGEFDQPEEDVFNASVDTSSWDTGWHNLSLRTRDGNNNWGPEGFYEVRITSTTSSAQQTSVVSSSKTDSNTDGTDETVTFTLENTGSSGVTIRNITVDSADNADVDQIGNGTRQTGGGPPSYADDGPELRSNRSGALLDVPDPFDLGVTQSLGTTSTISSGTRTEYTLAEFRNSDAGGGSEVDPGSQVTITLGFSDGSEKTVTLTL